MAAPAYARTFDLLRNRILGGGFAPGGLLPPERLLCGQFGVSRITVRHALRLLEEGGLIERRQGLGTFVRAVQERRIRIHTSDFPGSMRREAPGSTRRLLSRRLVVPDSDVAESLGLLRGERCAFAARVDELRSEPLASDRVHIPEALAGSLDDALLRRVDFLTVWLRREGLALSHCVQTIEAAGADAESAALLKVRRGTPVLRTRDLIHAADGRAVARFDSVFRGDRFRLVSTVRLEASGAHAD